MFELSDSITSEINDLVRELAEVEDEYGTDSLPYVITSDILTYKKKNLEEIKKLEAQLTIQSNMIDDLQDTNLKIINMLVELVKDGMNDRYNTGMCLSRIKKYYKEEIDLIEKLLYKKWEDIINET